MREKIHLERRMNELTKTVYEYVAKLSCSDDVTSDECCVLWVKLHNCLRRRRRHRHHTHRLNNNLLPCSSRVNHLHLASCELGAVLQQKSCIDIYYIVQQQQQNIYVRMCIYICTKCAWAKIASIIWIEIEECQKITTFTLLIIIVRNVNTNKENDDNDDDNNNNNNK